MPSLLETLGPARFLSHILHPFVWREGLHLDDLVIDSITHVTQGDLTSCIQPYGLPTDASAMIQLLDATLGRRLHDVVNFFTEDRVGSSILIPFWKQVK